jgi:hypothetical protein
MAPCNALSHSPEDMLTSCMLVGRAGDRVWTPHLGMYACTSTAQEAWRHQPASVPCGFTQPQHSPSTWHMPSCPSFAERSRVARRGLDGRSSQMQGRPRAKVPQPSAPSPARPPARPRAHTLCQPCSIFLHIGVACITAGALPNCGDTLPDRQYRLRSESLRLAPQRNSWVR